MSAEATPLSVDEDNNHNPVEAPSFSPSPQLSPQSRLMRNMAFMLLAVAVLGTGFAWWLWDGQSHGLYRDAFDFMKELDRLILLAVTATYLNRSDSH